MKSIENSRKDQVQKQIKLNEEVWNWHSGIHIEQGIENQNRSIRKSNFQIEFTNDGWLNYIMDGTILKAENHFEKNVQPEIIRNIDQIKNLRWKGEYDRKQRKVGKWNAYWRGDNINVGGYYNEDGKKCGKWIEPFVNYYEISQVVIKGEYKQGLKQGEWITYLQNQQIANGIYNEKGQKNGIWVELHDKYSLDRVVTFIGEYKNDLKQGRWMAFDQFSVGNDREIMQILQFNFYCGGGEYNNNGQKIGYWIDIHENYHCQCIVKYSGIYNDYGVRQGQWNIQLKTNYYPAFSQIGGGIYDDNGNKTGKWIELYDEFRNVCQVILEGEYSNGIKQGKWITSFRLNEKHKFKIIGGGEYDSQGRKIGKWIDLNDNFYKQCQVIESGQYENEQRIGSWIIKFRYTINEPFNRIGGGIYDVSGKKNGKWVEIFKNFQNSAQVTFVGDYQEGKKFGKWNIQLRKNLKERIQTIGGGIYDQRGLKHGLWNDLIENFRSTNYVIMKGDYQLGKKQGLWNIYYKKNPQSDLQIIGGGEYDQNSEKNGNWIDLNYSFGNEIFELLLIFMGKYKHGQKLKPFSSQNLI
ncbi:unnamed protein product [Paramecium sonneborni]|uniref:Uncharacterized protein n=1 Tax=Paramecium sonneborni TaxID=65129 RepID=A0A8S1MJR8_9CILI|nr:unnamed protein product [Paramecium sonneborni]